jgi:HK97 family phage portal protein
MTEETPPARGFLLPFHLRNTEHPMSSLLSRLRRLAGGDRPLMSAPDAKASRTAPLIAFSSQGRPVWSERNYAGFTREGFQMNPVAHRCIRLIAEAAASVPLYDAVDDKGPTAAEQLLARPNPRQAQSAFLEAACLQLLISGNAFIEVVTLDGDPRELHVLRTDRMRITPGPDGWPESYDYTVGGRTVRFAAGEGGSPILQLRQHNPLDDHYGLSPLEAAAAAIDIHNTASQWNKALLDNAARPSGALVYAAGGQNMTDQQFDRLRRELEETFQGAGNAGRPLLLEGGLDWKPLSLTPKDMDFIELKNSAAREIALALGVPPLVLGIAGDNTHANYAEANRSFWHQSVAPLVTRIAQELSQWLQQLTGDAIRLVPDFDAVDAMTSVREPIWQAVTAANFLTEDEKRSILGFGPRAGTKTALLWPPTKVESRAKPKATQ